MLLAVRFDVNFFLNFVFHPTPALLTGVAITVCAAIIAQVIGTIIGTFSALASLSRFLVLRLLSGVYVWFFRGTPTLVQLFLVYFGTPYLFGVDLFPTDMNLWFIHISGGIVAGTVTLAINEGSYMSEIVRAGIISVDSGQTEAALSLGMSRRLTMQRIVLPQALRVIIPPLGNDFNSILKLTSLLSVIGVVELFRVAEGVNAATFKTFEAFAGAALYYLVLLSLWNVIQGQIERRLGASAGREMRPGLLKRSLEFRYRKLDESAGVATRER